MINELSLRYPLKVWITAILVSPMLMIASEFMNFKDAQGIGSLVLGNIIFFVVQVFLCTLYFIPSFVIYTYVFNKFKTAKTSQFVIRVVLTLLALTTVFITLYIIQGKEAFKYNVFFGMNFSLFYACSILLSGFLYKMSWKENKTIDGAVF